MRWPHGFTLPTLRETVANCMENVRQAARTESEARAMVARLEVGDPRLQDAFATARRARHEQPNWREYATFYGRLLDRFPEMADQPAADAVAADRANPPMAKVLQLAPDRRLPREPGEDAEDLSF